MNLLSSTYWCTTGDCKAGVITRHRIMIRETHHSSANTYQKVMNYFTPKLWLGMTATPDKRDDDIEEKNIYQIFNYQIAYEIRLQQAMEENMLCPFHYF